MPTFILSIRECARDPARRLLATVLLAAAPLALAQAPPARLKVEWPTQEVPAAEAGIASVYAADLEGKLTASGQRYDPGRLTAAHRTLPLGTRVRVTDPATGASVRVVINDRWGGGSGRVVDPSLRAAEQIGLGSHGQLDVRLEVNKLGDGAVDPPEDEPVFREPLVPWIESTSNDPAGRTQRCENEAEIPGLRDRRRENHVRICLARQGEEAGALTPPNKETLRARKWRSSGWGPWAELEAANLTAFTAAWLYDTGKPCAAEANAAKFLAAEACYRACEQALLTHGGMGYAKDYHVERYLREAWTPRLAPVSPHLVLCFIAERVLGLPKSY